MRFHAGLDRYFMEDVHNDSEDEGDAGMDSHTAADHEVAGVFGGSATGTR